MQNEALHSRIRDLTPPLAGLAAGIAAALLVTLAACNTVEGAGRDIESAGDAIEDTASDAKD